MTMTGKSITDLTKETHLRIFKFALYNAQRIAEARNDSQGGVNSDGQGDQENPPEPVRWQWIEERGEAHSRRFPYNASGVCRLWHSILIEIPECWTRVIIDVASDPRRFLDIFLWSMNLQKLDVRIINSDDPDPDDINYSTLERQRVSAITNVLRPHTSRCKSITIDVAFFTSLPTPVIFLLQDAPDLRDLNIECRINNGDHPEEYAGTCDLGVRQRIESCASFPTLIHLNMTGFWFMLLASHEYTSKWFRELRDQADFLGFNLSQFKFQREGIYTLENFVRHCSDMQPSNMELRHLSLDLHNSAQESPSQPCYSQAFAHCTTVWFENVTPAVLQCLFDLTDISPTSLMIQECKLPYRTMKSNADKLSAYYIPQPSLADSWANEGSMFCGMFQGWTGNELNVRDSPGFNDNSFNFLFKPGKPSPMRMTLSNCSNFTVLGLRQFLEKRNAIMESEEGPDDELCMELIRVRGECPFPSQEDREWFETSPYGKYTIIDWQCVDEENPGVILTFDTFELGNLGPMSVDEGEQYGNESGTSSGIDENESGSDDESAK